MVLDLIASTGTSDCGTVAMAVGMVEASGACTGAGSAIVVPTSIGLGSAVAASVWTEGTERAGWMGRFSDWSFVGGRSAFNDATGGGAGAAGAALMVVVSVGLGLLETGGMVVVRFGGGPKPGTGDERVSSADGLGGTAVRSGRSSAGDSSGDGGLSPSTSAFCISSFAMSSFRSPILCAASLLLPVRSLWVLWVWYSEDFSPKIRRMVSRRDSSVLARTASR